MKKLGRLCSQGIAILWAYLPWSINLALGQFLAFLWIDIFRIRRQVILQNLDIAFPEKNLTEKKMLAKASMVSLCRSFFDVMKIPSLTDSWIDQNVIISGLDKIHELKSKQTGVFFLTLHLGSGDVGAAILSRRVWKSCLITKRFKNQFLDAFWFGLRGRSETEFIDAHSERNAFDILSALRKKKAVIFVLDQYMGKPFGIASQFFGVKTGTAYGLALFVKKTKLPVIPIYTYWGEDRKLRISVGEAVALSPELSETHEEMTNRFNQELEKIIRQHPDQWMWVHRRWKKFE